MKKSIITLIMCGTIISGLSITAHAANNTAAQVTATSNILMINQQASESVTDPYESEEAKGISEIHQFIVKNYKSNIKLNTDGTITISNLDKLILNKKFKEEYKNWLKSANFCVKNDMLKFNDSFQLDPIILDKIPSEKKVDTSNQTQVKPNSVTTLDSGGAISYGTFDLNGTAWQNGQYMYNLAEAQRPYGAQGRAVVYSTFANYEKSGGAWDFKRTLGLNSSYKVKIGSSTFFLTGEQIGNIHYGYVGRAAGIPATTLKSAAGIVQIYSGTSSLSFWSSYFDDASDQNDIKRGINWRDTYNFN